MGDYYINSIEDASNSVNLYYNSFFTLFEYLVFTSFLYIGVHNSKVKKLILLLSFGFIGFLVLNFFRIEDLLRIDSVQVGIETLLILCYSFYLLFEMTNTIRDSFINYNYRFWVIIGIITYLSGSFFIYLYANQLTPQEGRKFEILVNFFYILKNIFFAVAIIVCYRQPKPKTPPSSVPFLDMDTR